MSADPIFADRLIDAIRSKGSPICVGIDPIYENLPDAIAGPAHKRDANDIEAVVDAIFDFTTSILKIVAPHVPCVKFQSAYFEKFLWEGVEAYFNLIHEAKELGLVVIGDVKRGDIGSTSDAYAAAHLADPPFPMLEDVRAPDAITVNPFCGLDTIEPFINTAKAESKGLFVLVRTSNPGSAALQDAKLEDGRTYSESLADLLQPLAHASGIGEHGYSSIGAVVGATQTHTMRSIRKRLPNSIFLLPGYGTQGATAEMTKAAFDKNSNGAIVSASRSILYPSKDRATKNWIGDVEDAVHRMREDLSAIVV